MGDRPGSWDGYTEGPFRCSEQGPEKVRGEGIPPYEELPPQAAPADGKGPCPDRGPVSKEAEGILQGRDGICGVMEARGREEGPLPPGEGLYGPEDAGVKQ